MNAEIQKQKIKDVQVEIRSLKYALGFARYDRPSEVEWLEGQLVKAEAKLAKLEQVA